MAGEKSTIRDLDRSLQRTIDEHRAELKSAIKRLEARVVAKMKKLKTTESGNLIGVKVNLKQAQRLHAELATLFSEEFGTAVEAYVDEFPEIAREIATSWGELDAAVKFTGADKSLIDALRTNAYDQFAVLGEQARQIIVTQMYDYVAAQGSWTDLVNAVRGALTGHEDARGTPLSQYADTWAIDAQMTFGRTLSVSKADEAGLGEHWLYAGSIIEDSRDFCRERAGGIFTTEEVESWNSLEWAGKRGNVWSDLGGWRCRHTLQPVKREWFPDVPVDELSEVE